MGGNRVGSKLMVAALTVAAALLMSACNKQGTVEDKSVGGASGSGGTVSLSPAATVPDDAQVMTVHAKEYEFDPSTLSLKAGKPVAITLIDDGALAHDLSVYDSSGNPVDGAITNANPGASGIAIFTLQAGSYTFKCTLPGHEVAGMSGTITVK